MQSIITGLDLGSQNMRAAAAEIRKDGSIRLLSLENMPSRGISSKGITDFESARADIAELIGKLERNIGRKIRSVSVVLNLEGTEWFLASGMIGLSQRPRRIRDTDIERSKKIAKFTHLACDKQVIHNEIHSFYINEGDPVADPTGLYATKLTVKLYVITSDASKIMSLNNCVEQAGYIMEDMVFFGRALFHSVLTDEERKSSIALIDIGAQSTNIAVFEKGALKHIGYIKRGAFGLKDASEFKAYREKLKKSLPKDLAYSKAVVTGGGSLKENMLENLESELGIACELGRVKLNWCRLTPKDAILHASSLGVIEYKARKLDEKKRITGNPLKRSADFVTDLMESYF